MLEHMHVQYWVSKGRIVVRSVNLTRLGPPLGIWVDPLGSCPLVAPSKIIKHFVLITSRHLEQLGNPCGTFLCRTLLLVGPQIYSLQYIFVINVFILFILVFTVIHNRAEPLCGMTEISRPGKTVLPYDEGFGMLVMHCNLEPPDPKTWQ